jgi:hypothetical protein
MKIAASVMAPLAGLAVAACGSPSSGPTSSPRTIHARLTGYDTGNFCDMNGVTFKVQCGCPYSPCEDGDPATRGDYCSADGNACLPGLLGPAEVCDNGVDDDGDGLVDGEDPDCQRLSCMGDPCPPDQICDWDGYCSPHCANGWWDGDEGDVDCGGSCPTACAVGQHCWGPADCTTFKCVGDVCVN